MASTAAAAGRHRIDPGASIDVSVAITAVDALDGTRLVMTIPDGWAFVDSDGGVFDPLAGRVTWDLAGVAAGAAVAHRIGVTAPSASPIDGSPSFGATFASSVETDTGPIATATTDLLVAPAIVVEHHAIGQVTEGRSAVTYGPTDGAMTDQQRFDTFRVRFQLRNADDVPVAITPRLEVAAEADTTFTPVAADEVSGAAFRATREWVARPAGGTELGPTAAPIAIADLLITDVDGPDQVAVAGSRAMGANPMPSITLAGRSYTEIEFSVRATVDAPYLGRFVFRVTDDGRPLVAARPASVAMGARPAVQPLTLFRDGIPVGSPATAMDSEVTPSGTGAGSNATASTPTAGGPRYRLVATGPATSTGSAPAAPASPIDGPHGPYAIASDACAACHSSHSATTPTALLKAPATSLCLTCHRSGGSAASTDVAGQYDDPNVPQNDPLTRTYYRHDPTAGSAAHSKATANEFGGQLNRHSTCADCHSPHDATSTNSTQTVNGWTISGRLGNVSGVRVTNSTTAGGTPTYTFVDGQIAKTGQPTRLTYEYELCFKCHSGFTQLPLNDKFTPSRYVLDKAVELNPNNQSFHPIEAQGTNQTDAMQASLQGPSTYKQWNFQRTSTIRCQDCHGDSRKYDLSLPENGTDATRAGDDLAPHANNPGTAASPVPGVLLQSYTYRQLKSPGALYAPADFALCFLCHAEAPFLDQSGDTRTDTNFRYHGLHVSGIAGKGPSGTDIDQANNGGGRAICAECHFRIHGTTYRVGNQDAYQRLVNFAPNVTDDGSLSTPVGKNAWDQPAKNCTLTCHGQGHTAEGY